MSPKSHFPSFGHFPMFLLLVSLGFKWTLESRADDRNQPRENKFCKQTNLGAVYSLGEFIFTQFNDGQWMWYPEGIQELYAEYALGNPQREMTIRQLFYLNINYTTPQYSQLIHNSFTGFLVTKDTFGGIPRNVGLLISTDFDISMWITLDRHGSSGSWLQATFSKWSGIATQEMNNFLSDLKGTKSLTLHFIEKHNKLIVGYKETSGFQVKVYSDSLSKSTMVQLYPEDIGRLFGMFAYDEKTYFLAEKSFGIFDPEKETFNRLTDHPQAANAHEADKSLLNFLYLFECPPFGKESPEDELSNLDRVNLVLNAALMFLNCFLLLGVIYFYRSLRQRETRSGSKRKRKPTRFRLKKVRK